MKVGRPSDYDPKYIKILEEYLKEAVPENMDIPTLEGFCLKIGKSKPAIYRWVKENKEFRYSIRKLKMSQKNHLVKIGIFGGKEINPTIVALMLRVNHKMVETTKTDITTDGEKLNNLVIYRPSRDERVEAIPTSGKSAKK